MRLINIFFLLIILFNNNFNASIVISDEFKDKAIDTIKIDNIPDELLIYILSYLIDFDYLNSVINNSFISYKDKKLLLFYDKLKKNVNEIFKDVVKIGYVSKKFKNLINESIKNIISKIESDDKKSILLIIFTEDRLFHEFLHYLINNNIINRDIINNKSIIIKKYSKDYVLIPLIIAATKGYLNIIKLFIQNGAQIDIDDSNKSNALMKAAYYNYFDIVKFLIEQRAININNKDIHGYTALMKAAFNGCLKIVRYLVENGSDINLKSNYGATALLVCTFRGYDDLVEFFLNQDIDINARNNDGNTALILAAIQGHYQIINLLINKKANINLANNYGWTALMIAIFKDHLDVVKLFVENGADINLRANDGQNALEIAINNRKLDIVKFLNDFTKSE